MIDFERLKEIEKNNELFKRKYNGVNYWQMIRLNLTGEEFSENAIKDHRSIFFHDIFLYSAKNIFRDLIELGKNSKCDILYFDQGIYRHIDDEWKDPYFDHFEIEKSYSVYRCYYLKERITKRGIGISIPLTKYYIYRALAKIVKGFYEDKDENTQIEKLEILLKNNGNKTCVKKEIKKAVLMYKAYTAFYERLLKKCTPRVVIVCCYYEETMYPLYQLCREKGIPVIELQHGLVSGVDAYTYEDLTTEGKQLQSHIFSYGEIWTDYIKMPSITKVVPIGNAFLENRKEKYSYLDMDNKKIVIYSFPYEREKLVDLSIYMAQNLPEYQILLKLHPNEIKYFDEIEKKIREFQNLRIVDKNMELYELLSSAGHHIAISSTVLYEASIYKSRRYVYSIPKYIARMQPLIDAGLAVAFHVKDEIIKLIQISDDMAGTLQDDNPIWKKNAVKNAHCALEKIIKGQL